LALAIDEQMLVANVEAKRNFPFLDKHVLNDIEISRHQLGLAITCVRTSAKLCK
jgi:hypothetical protein